MVLFHKIKSYLLEKFSKMQLLCIVIVIVLGFFVSDSSLISRFQYDMEIRDLKNQIEFYQEKYTSDKEKLELLKSDKANIEKFARENYLMKKDDEDVFVIE